MISRMDPVLDPPFENDSYKHFLKNNNTSTGEGNRERKVRSARLRHDAKNKNNQKRDVLDGPKKKRPKEAPVPKGKQKRPKHTPSQKPSALALIQGNKP